MDPSIAEAADAHSWARSSGHSVKKKLLVDRWAKERRKLI
jgi:hypothetical protein